MENRKAGHTIDVTKADEFSLSLETQQKVAVASHCCGSQSVMTTCEVRDPIPKEERPGVYRIKEH